MNTINEDDYCSNSEKLKYGIGGIFIILLETALLILLMLPGKILGIPYYFGLSVFLIFMTWLLLDKSIKCSNNIILKLWYGITAGMIAWTLTEVSGSGFHYVSIETHEGVFIFLLVVAILVAVWQTIADSGIRYFLITFMVNWGGHVIIKSLHYFVKTYPALLTLLNVVGYISIVGVVIMLLYLWKKKVMKSSSLLTVIVNYYFISNVLYILIKK